MGGTAGLPGHVGRRRYRIALALVVGAGALVRALPCWNDFWLDEVWTWLIAADLSSPLEVFTGIHHSNNHHLNTLLFYALGDRPGWVYRLPSLVAGVASIALAAGVAARRSRLDSLLAALLTASCFALVHFSSEARGYSTAVLFALGALWALQLDLERPRAWTAFAFAACVVLGFLSQLVFLFFWAGAAAQSSLVVMRRHGPTGRRLAQLARLHGAPLLCLALLVAVDLSRLHVEGGNPANLAWLLPRMVRFSLGVPARSWATLPAGLLALGLAGLGLFRLARRGESIWLLYAVAIFVAPAATLAVTRPEVLALRYFLIGIALCLLLWAAVLADALRAGGAQRAGALSWLALFVLGNSWHAAEFLEHGRGGYRTALDTMARLTPGERLEVGSDHDFRNGTVLGFHARELPPGKRLDYRARDAWPPGGPHWLIIHRPERPARIRDRLVLDSGESFELVRSFDHAAISGFWWGLYRNLRAAPREAPE